MGQSGESDKRCDSGAERDRITQLGQDSLAVDYDAVYDGLDADEMVTITMTRRQWWHLDDWRAEHPDRYPKRAAERDAAWEAIRRA